MKQLRRTYDGKEPLFSIHQMIIENAIFTQHIPPQIQNIPDEEVEIKNSVFMTTSLAHYFQYFKGKSIHIHNCTFKYQITSLKYMFADCKNLETIIVSDNLYEQKCNHIHNIDMFHNSRKLKTVIFQLQCQPAMVYPIPSVMYSDTPFIQKLNQNIIPLYRQKQLLLDASHYTQEVFKYKNYIINWQLSSYNGDIYESSYVIYKIPDDRQYQLQNIINMYNDKIQFIQYQQMINVVNEIMKVSKPVYKTDKMRHINLYRTELIDKYTQQQ